MPKAPMHIDFSPMTLICFLFLAVLLIVWMAKKGSD